MLAAAFFFNLTLLVIVDGFPPDFGAGIGVANTITRGKVFGDMWRAVDSVRGQNVPFPINKASRC